jgi:inosine-uridine nucleoside N-ribohydrolase
MPTTLKDLVFDMETADPDDFLTLLLLLGRTDINLKAVTVTPGTPDQIGLVRKALSWFSKNIPVGAYNLKHPKSCVSPWHYNVFGEISPSHDAADGFEVLIQCCDEETTLVTGAPLKNLGKAIRHDESRGGGLLKLGRWVAQGGFAGEGIVPREKQLTKFKGRSTCPTYNLNGDPKSALLALNFKGVRVKRFVSKNVCHGVYYDAAIHKKVAELRDQHLSFELIWKGMDYYLMKHRAGKKFHDTLAACCAINESIGIWEEVELYRERDEWGSRLSTGSNTWIITDYDRVKFIQTFLSC